MGKAVRGIYAILPWFGCYAGKAFRNFMCLASQAGNLLKNLCSNVIESVISWNSVILGDVCLLYLFLA